MTAATTATATTEATGPERIFKETTAERKVVSWLPGDQIEEATRQQIWNLATLPSSFHVAVMPDAHKGYGMPIGCALATEGTVVPYAVGLDIGCGMVAEPLGVKAKYLRVRETLEGVLRRVPVGMPGKGRGQAAGSFTERRDSRVLREWAEQVGDADNETRERADRQLGTLGSGNHFIELQADEEGQAWVMLHSGSRSFGKAVCDRWHRRALEWCDRYRTALPDRDLAFLALDTPDGEGYMRDMGYAMRFAEESRGRMLDAVHEALAEAGTTVRIDYMRRVETHHNFAARERHMGRDVVVHRKGAVRTSTWQAQRRDPVDELSRLPVTIPGSMQTGSYIGLGIANVLALNTCAHGAGRRFGRKAFMRDNVGVDIRAEMEAGGIVLVTPEGSDTLDESGRAYKDIEGVMRYQSDLVTPTVKLRPLGVVKG